jgi:hypothetical protein
MPITHSGRYQDQIAPTPREAPVMRAVPFDDELLMFLPPE